jgi:hypothetical protein
VRVDRFKSEKGSLDVSLVSASFPVKTTILATGSSALGRGVHGAIPLHVVFEARDIEVTSGALKYKLALTSR